MVKIIFLVLLIGGVFYYINDTGIIYNLTHEMQPEPGKQCELSGPTGLGVCVVKYRDDIKLIADSQTGTEQQKAAGRERIAEAVDKGDIAVVPDTTKVRVKMSSVIDLHGNKQPVTEVEVVGGTNPGYEGWVEREDVTDTPLQQIFQLFRGGKKSD